MYKNFALFSLQKVYTTNKSGQIFFWLKIVYPKSIVNIQTKKKDTGQFEMTHTCNKKYVTVFTFLRKKFFTCIFMRLDMVFSLNHCIKFLLFL